MERFTRQRNAVFAAFEDPGRVLAVPEILARAQRHVAGLNRSTVYRQLSALLESGDIVKVELPGEPARYERACAAAPDAQTEVHAHGHSHSDPNAHARGHGHSHGPATGEQRHHHHYFHCNSCGQVFLLHACPGPMAHLAPEGFVTEEHELTLRGRCAACAAS